MPSRLQFFSYGQNGQWDEDVVVAQSLEWFSRDAGKADEVDEKAIRAIIYGVENLRKRPGSED
jgi:tRNA (guanine-N(7)-)-methyltransferase subunit TRM82